MITDLQYNVTTQDWDMDNGDFVITPDASVQNGGIMLETRAFSSSQPIFGIGIYQLKNAIIAQVNYQFNRWKQMIYADNGRAQVTVVYVNGVPTFEWGVNYD